MHVVPASKANYEDTPASSTPAGEEVTFQYSCSHSLCWKTLFYLVGCVGLSFAFTAVTQSTPPNLSCMPTHDPLADSPLRIFSNESSVGCVTQNSRLLPMLGDVPTAEYIRAWMGDMSRIIVVGKHAARLGQSLSSTTSTVEVRPER